MARGKQRRLHLAVNSVIFILIVVVASHSGLILCAFFLCHRHSSLSWHHRPRLLLRLPLIMFVPFASSQSPRGSSPAIRWTGMGGGRSVRITIFIFVVTTISLRAPVSGGGGSTMNRGPVLLPKTRIIPPATNMVLPHGLSTPQPMPATAKATATVTSCCLHPLACDAVRYYQATMSER